MERTRIEGQTCEGRRQEQNYLRSHEKGLSVSVRSAYAIFFLLPLPAAAELCRYTEVKEVEVKIYMMIACGSTCSGSQIKQLFYRKTFHTNKYSFHCFEINRTNLHYQHHGFGQSDVNYFVTWILKHVN